MREEGTTVSFKIFAFTFFLNNQNIGTLWFKAQKIVMVSRIASRANIVQNKHENQWIQ